MSILSTLKEMTGKALSFFRGSAAAISEAVSAKRASPIADRILSDSLRFAELPSPTEREEKRAVFALERLAEFGAAGSVDEDGNVLARFPSPEAADSRPLLLFADMGTSRWNPLGSLARVDPEVARGAGIADSLGAAALLSVVEGVLDGSIKAARDILVLFAARALDDPRSGVFVRLADDPATRPIAALGVRGLALGALAAKPLGTYRISVQVRVAEPAQGNPASQGEGGGAAAPRTAVSVVASVAQRLGGIRWDAEGSTACRVRRVLAGTGFGRFPAEGLVDIELESADAGVLEMAMKAVIATAETIGRESGAQMTVAVVGHVPVGDPTVSESLRSLAKESMKALRIKQTDFPGADPSAFLSARGVPSISVGIASGREGLESDEVNIASLETGRRLLVDLIERIDSGKSAALPVAPAPRKASPLFRFGKKGR